MGKTLLDKVWALHKVRTMASGVDQLLIGLHLVHEVTSPQAFAMLREKGLPVAFPERTCATVDHIVPTTSQARPLEDPLAEAMLTALETNTRDFGIRYFGFGDPRQGIVHAVGPETGLTQPGLTIVCGDSHTSTHGAFGALAFGIGTSQLRDVLATGCLAIAKPKLRRIRVTGRLQPGVYAKDVILRIIRDLGVNGGLGYAYEYAGEVFDNFSMEERMTVCNMSIEGGARMGYVNPDTVTFDYLRGRPFAPADMEKAVAWWRTLASDADAVYDDEVVIDGGTIEPMVTWGINPGQGCAISESIPELTPFDDRASVAEALAHMQFRPGETVRGKKPAVVFIGSCTNGRLSDLREAARFVRGRRVRDGIRALVVPGSAAIKAAAEAEGLDRVFSEAGFQWRFAGCSMCLAMNPDRLQGDELCASTSNRNFRGRQGSPAGRTILMSPAMAALAAVEGRIVDVREHL